VAGRPPLPPPPLERSPKGRLRLDTLKLNIECKTWQCKLRLGTIGIQGKASKQTDKTNKNTSKQAQNWTESSLIVDAAKVPAVDCS
jgi:hypothetical protein